MMTIGNLIKKVFNLKINLGSLAVVMLFVTGCATQPVAIQTPSGRPEVFIAGVTPEQVKPLIISNALSKGWKLEQDTTYQITFSQPTQNLAAIIFYGSRYDSQPNIRGYFTLTSINGGTHIYYNGEIVTNPGSAFERKTPIEQADPKAFSLMQESLEKLKAQFVTPTATVTPQ